MVLHRFDEKSDMQTMILGTIGFDVQYTKGNISKAMLKVGSIFGIFPLGKFIEEIP